jgi:hypothetical protein
MDILEAVSVEIPCCACGGRYGVTLKQIELSQEMLHEGCPVQSETECPPLTYSGLIDPKELHQLRRIWVRLEKIAEKAGGQLRLNGGDTEPPGDRNGRSTSAKQA